MDAELCVCVKSLNTTPPATTDVPGRTRGPRQTDWPPAYEATVRQKNKGLLRSRYLKRLGRERVPLTFRLLYFVMVRHTQASFELVKVGTPPLIYYTLMSSLYQA